MLFFIDKIILSVQSIIGATEKRRESGAICRGIGASESAG